MLLLYGADLTPAMQAQVYLDTTRAIRTDMLEVGRNNFSTLASLLSVIYEPKKEGAVLNMHKSQIYIADNFDQLPEEARYLSIYFLDRDIDASQYGLESLSIPELEGDGNKDRKIVADGFKNIMILFTMIANGIKFYDQNYARDKKSILYKYVPFSKLHFETIIRGCVQAAVQHDDTTFKVKKDQGEWGARLMFDRQRWADRFTQVYGSRDVVEKKNPVAKVNSELMDAYLLETRDAKLKEVRGKLKKEGQNSFLTLASFVNSLWTQVTASIKAAEEVNVGKADSVIVPSLALTVDFKQKVFYVADDYNDRDQEKKIFLLDAGIPFAKEKYEIHPLFTDPKYQSEWKLTGNKVDWFVGLMRLMANKIKQPNVATSYMMDTEAKLKAWLERMKNEGVNFDDPPDRAVADGSLDLNAIAKAILNS